MKKKLIYTYLTLFLAFNAQGQMAFDTIKLPEVRLMESKLSNHDIGIHVDVINTELLAEGSSVDLGNLISGSSSLFVKSYGALATPTFRGTSSSHTLVLWNGIPINSLANGLSDLSGIYCHKYKDIYIVRGGDASIFGSGAIGGSIHLNTELVEKKEILLSNTKGSYGLSSQAIDFSFNNQNLFVSGGLHYLNHVNDFEYVNITQIGRPLSVNDYGVIKLSSYNLDILYQLNKNTKYGLNYWASNLDREVSQNMTTPFSDAKQLDDNKRLLISLNHNINKLRIILKQAYLQEDFSYTEVSKNIFSNYLSKSYISDVDIKFLKNNYSFNLGAAFTNNRLDNNNYTSNLKTEKSFAVFSSLQYKLNNLVLNHVLRKEWQTTFKVPLIPTISFDFKLTNSINFRAKYNRSFRSPTFNDRFWVGSGSNGNIFLKPEESWNKEAGVDFNLKDISFSITAYNLNINDMILWGQTEIGNWTPSNVKKVFSRGVEVSTKIMFNKLIFTGNYTYTKSTNERATTALDNSVGQQLRYVPLHKGNFNISIVDGDLQFSLNNSFTGEVVTTYGEQENNTLDSFVLTDFAIKYKLNFLPISYQIKVKNLMDKYYITYENYPNPGRELLLTINYIIN